MKIAILGSVAVPVPPPFQGGTEWIVYHQAKGLSERGHKVILFASRAAAENFKNPNIRVVEVGGGNLVSGSKAEISLDPSLVEGSRKFRLETAYLSKVGEKLLELKDNYDIILNNMRGEAVFLPLAKLLDKPLVNVMHLNIFDELAGLFRDFNTKIITISNSQRKSYPDLNYLATVYNGVDTKKFIFSDRPGDYLLMLGSIGWHKNQGAAIRVAKALGLKLILAGKIRDKNYFEELKKDIDGEKIKWFGELSFENKVKLYKEAKVFLFPINWEEPFGLVMIESMSCGTPVVAFNHGAVSEVVVNGLTGYIVENDSQMVEAIRKINQIKRENCRKHVEENFTVEKMVDDYEKALLRIEI